MSVNFNTVSLKCSNLFLIEFMFKSPITTLFVVPKLSSFILLKEFVVVLWTSFHTDLSNFFQSKLCLYLKHFHLAQQFQIWTIKNFLLQLPFEWIQRSLKMVKAVDQTISKDMLTTTLQMNSDNRKITFRNCAIITDYENSSSAFIVESSVYVFCKRSNDPRTYRDQIEQTGKSQKKLEQPRITQNNPKTNFKQTERLPPLPISAEGSQHLGGQDAKHVDRW